MRKYICSCCRNSSTVVRCFGNPVWWTLRTYNRCCCKTLVIALRPTAWRWRRITFDFQGFLRIPVSRHLLDFGVSSQVLSLHASWICQAAISLNNIWMWSLIFLTSLSVRLPRTCRLSWCSFHSHASLIPMRIPSVLYQNITDLSPKYTCQLRVAAQLSAHHNRPPPCNLAPISSAALLQLCD